jgi:hypothetical protein
LGFGITGTVHEISNGDREIIVLKGADGARYTMIVRANGTLAITRDGALLHKQHWKAADVDECVKTLYKLAGRAQTAG